MTDIAATIWQPPKPDEGEYTSISAVSIVDPSGESIVDPTDSTIAIVSTTSDYVEIPSTIFTSSDGS